MSLVTLHYLEEYIAVLTLNREKAANSLSNNLLDELQVKTEEIRQSPARVVVITGAGEKAFCAGADLKERSEMTEQEVVAAVKKIGDTIRKVEQLPIPVIAMINGAAYGGGLELALACDLRVMADHTKVGLTETSLAIIPGAGGTQRLPRLISPGHAKRLIFTAKPVTAEEALQLNLVESIYSADRLEEETLALARQIASNGPVALKQAKKAIDCGLNTNLQTGLAFEHECYKYTIPTSDRLEGLQAFKEKRSPSYKGE
ncbi:enoyl-CoA hydratase [Halobacillus sp. Marseille-Q1614]|uniref:enoyl-CoA hydratase n=1 Tax=Halobacillus sp. Marseille-Q1614 TaxID=2709134 RepID=UPI00157025B8|nr:enoyl-CoA hydratase [Halobacillus sp. Marseille-Q1614]